jgi:simple sugar transport system permease protein
VTAYNAAAIVLGVVAGMVVVAYAGGNLGVALSTLFLNPITTDVGIQQTFVRFVLIYTMALGIGLALKAGLWNIGGYGQWVVGMVMVFVAYDYLAFLPYPLLYLSMLLLPAVGGLLWIAVPTILRVKFGANEIVVTLLLNVVGTNFGYYMLFGPIGSVAGYGYPYSKTLTPEYRIPEIVNGVPITYAVPLTIAIGIILYFLVERTSFRVKANTVGESIETARYAGISINRIMIITMLAAGALAGFAGATFRMGNLGDYALNPGSFVPYFGFIAVIAAMVGRKHMLGIGLSSFFFAYFTWGAQAMATVTNLQTSVVLPMEGVMMIGILLTAYLERRGTI